MWSASLRFYAELNDFLPESLRYRDNPAQCQPGSPVRHLIERFGVPHTEVELVILNGRSVGLEEPVPHGARISLYPLFEALDVSPLVRLRERPLREPAFVADAHLGRLARYLRLLGFDTLFENDPGDAALAARSIADKRVLLTRDRALLMRRGITHGCYIRPQKPLAQLTVVLQRLDLYRQIRPFTRCMRCNGLLQPADKAAVQDELLPDTRQTFDEFWRCTGCGRIYWKGSHFASLSKTVEKVAQQLRKPG